jgi:hypothetical protein
MNPFRNGALSRRTFLRGTGAAVALPLLDAMRPAIAASRTAATAESPRRMLAILTNQGILPQFFFPQQAGRDYQLTPYLEHLRDFREQFTVFSGLSHPDVSGGHPADKVFLTAAPGPAGSGFKNSVSIDQLAAETLGAATRFPTLSLQVGTGSFSLSHTRNGVLIPAERSAARLYRRMFVQGDADEVQQRVDDLRRGRSTLDFVRESARKLDHSLAAVDRRRMDQYFTSIRELENQLLAGEAWEHRPKPRVNEPEPTDIRELSEFIPASRLMFKMARLALETDSTRLVTLFLTPVSAVPALPGVTHETHTLTHHGNRPEMIEELSLIEHAQFAALHDLLADLHAKPEQDQTLLDRTMVLYGTHMGSANAHNNVNLPVLLAGGGFRHGQHAAFDTKNNLPLSNLFVTMLQRLGLEVDRFGSSTGTLRGLEPT